MASYCAAPAGGGKRCTGLLRAIRLDNDAGDRATVGVVNVCPALAGCGYIAARFDRARQACTTQTGGVRHISRSVDAHEADTRRHEPRMLALVLRCSEVGRTEYADKRAQDRGVWPGHLILGSSNLRVCLLLLLFVMLMFSEMCEILLTA